MSTHRLRDIILDPQSLAAASADDEHERRIAIFDLLEANTFSLPDIDKGPYALRLSTAEGRLVFVVEGEDGAEVRTIILSLTPFRKTIKDYFLICDSYNAAIKNASSQQIEAIDMGRRALHNEGGALLIERLEGKAQIDHDTARRLFTLICALHVRS
ncbi:MAG: UPF0262 family protein [Hydrogenophilaceae bacterium]|jgi:uncharacterized protein (UPF0262 family)|nr:UPF0262 family protein [Hydrogenophilaceae bacterium]